MAQITDSSLSMDIVENIASSESNDGIVSRESAKYKFGKITFDDPLMIPRQFWDLFDLIKIREEVPPYMRYKPELFASVHYGTSDLWWFVLLSNNMTQHTDFCNNWAYRVDSSIVGKLEDLLEATTVIRDTTVELHDLTLYPVKV